MTSAERDAAVCGDESSAPNATGSVLDTALALFAMHAAAVDRCRRAAIAFQSAKAELEAQQSLREQMRAGRVHAATHREHVRIAVALYVTHLRDIGTPPERMLVTLRERIALMSRTAGNCIPSLDMQVLLTDVSEWAITAYYAAA